MLKIGDFARLGQVSIKTLRHYDATGLLKPAQIDTYTGYRYYTVDQLFQLNHILVLKDLGFSLEQISRLLREGVPVEFVREMLNVKRTELERRVQAEQRLLARVEARLQQIHQEEERAMSETTDVQERELPAMVLGGIVIMPLMTIPLQIEQGQGKSAQALQQARHDEKEVLIIFVDEHEITSYAGNKSPTPPSIGVIARMQQFAVEQNGTMTTVLEGVTRARIASIAQSSPFYRVRCTPISDPEASGTQVEALSRTVKQQLDAAAAAAGIPQEAVAFVHAIDAPGNLADVVTYTPEFAFADRMAVLTTLDPFERLQKASQVLARGTV